MTDPNTYLGGDNWMLARPFTKDTWFMILITTVIFLTIMKLFSFLPVIKSIDFKTSEKARNIVYLSFSFFFLLILAYYEGALIMFFSSGTSDVFGDIKDVMNLYPRQKLMMREGYDIYYLHYVKSGDKDYIDFWNRVKENPEETVYANLHEVFHRFPEGGVVIHENEGAIKVHLDACGGKREEHFDVYVRGEVEYRNLLVTKNSPLGPILNYGSRLLLQRGSTTDFKRSWNINHTNCISLRQRPSKSMSMQFRHFAYLFLFLVACFFICIFIFAGEVVWKQIIGMFPSLAPKISSEYDVRTKDHINRARQGRYIGNPVFYSLQILDVFSFNKYREQNARMGTINPQSSSFQVIVKTFTFEMFVIQINPKDTIQVLKSKIKDESGIPTNLQRLRFSGDILENNTSLCNYNIYYNSVIDCIRETGKSYSF